MVLITKNNKKCKPHKAPKFRHFFDLVYRPTYPENMSFLSYHKKKVAITKDTNIKALRKKAKRYQLSIWVDNIQIAEEINTKDKQKMEYKMDLLECIKTRLEELQTQKSQQNEILKAAAHYLQAKVQSGNESAISHPEELIKVAETFLTPSKNQG